jgi:hypothetical protein
MLQKLKYLREGLCPLIIVYNRAREDVHPVYVAEIYMAVPKLCDTTFNTEQGSIRLHTNVALKLYTKTRWFDLPHPESVDIKAIKKKVFVDIFGMECWKGLKEGSSIEESTHEYDLPLECPICIAWTVPKH